MFNYKLKACFACALSQALDQALEIITDQSTSSAPYQCDDAQRSELKRKFILLRSKTHGLADLRINENIENIHVDMQNCHVKNIQQNNRKF